MWEYRYYILFSVFRIQHCMHFRYIFFLSFGFDFCGLGFPHMNFIRCGLFISLAYKSKSKQCWMLHAAHMKWTQTHYYCWRWNVHNIWLLCVIAFGGKRNCVFCGKMRLKCEKRIKHQTMCLLFCLIFANKRFAGMHLIDLEFSVFFDRFVWENWKYSINSDVDFYFLDLFSNDCEIIRNRGTKFNSHCENSIKHSSL